MQDIPSLRQDIRQLKEERNAILLVHNYQLPEVQDMRDLTGDSLELSRAAATMDGDVIVFCGVDFMAETAAILSPEKTVLLPAGDACCPMAQMITAEDLKIARERHRTRPSSVMSTPPQRSRQRAISAAPPQTR